MWLAAEPSGVTPGPRFIFIVVLAANPFSVCAADTTDASTGLFLPAAPREATRTDSLPRAYQRLGHDPRLVGGSDVCASDQCRAAADWLKGYIDLSADPCQDFSAFTCSAAKKREFASGCDKCKEFREAALSEKCLKTCDSDIGLVAETTRKRLEKIVRDAAHSPESWGDGLAPLAKVLGNAFQACTNRTVAACVKEGKGEPECVQPVKRYLAQLSDAASLEKFVAEAGEIRDLGQGFVWYVKASIFSLLVLLDKDKPSQGMKLVFVPTIADMDPQVTFMRSGTYDDPLRGLGSQTEQLPGFAGSIEQAKAAFLATFGDGSPLRPTLGNLSLVADRLEGYTSSLDMLPFMRVSELQATANELAGASGLGISLPDVLSEFGVDDAILHIGGNETDLSVWARNVSWMFSDPTRARRALAIKRWMNYNDLVSVQAMDEEGARILGILQPCEVQLQAVFPWLLSRKLASEVLTEKGRDEAEEAAWQIVQAMAVNLHDLPWIDNETANAAKVKLRHIGVKIGYPHWITGDDILLHYYDFALKVDFSSPLGWLELQLASQRRELERSFRRVDATRDWESYWIMPPIEVNMSYNPMANDMLGMAAFLQKPLFDQSMPMFYNFGYLGVSFGREITHAFHSSGATRGPYGDSKNWWTAASVEHFDQQKACFVKQYSENPLYGDQPDGTRNVSVTLYGNGTKCLGEGIADGGGLGLGHLAYQQWMRDYGREPRLAGLEQYSVEQLFFMRFGAGWCDYQLTAELNATIHGEDNHAVNRMRVIGSVQNSRTFAQAFNCDEGSPMSPREKCEIWGIEQASGLLPSTTEPVAPSDSDQPSDFGPAVGFIMLGLAVGCLLGAVGMRKCGPARHFAPSSVAGAPTASLVELRQP